GKFPEETALCTDQLSQRLHGLCVLLLCLVYNTQTWMDADMSAGICMRVSSFSSVSPFSTQITCQKRPSGHLVSVLGGVEGSFEASLLKNNLKIFSDIWIGLHDPTEDSEPNASGWEWSSTDVLNYVAWERNPATVSNPGYCERLSRNTGYLKWRDYNCYVNLPYVCKFTD
ncbi:hypothetical protein E2I00_013646, partial [Balaenoptera physalus]